MAENSVKKFLDLAGLQHIIEKLYARGFNGLGLSQENFTTALLAKLNATATTEGMAELNSRIAAVEKLIESDKDGTINKFNEIVSFLAGIADSTTLEGILAAKANAADVYSKTEADGKFATPAAVDTKLEPYAKTADVTAELAKKVSSTDLATEMEGKVDKVSGKGLSTNDYTTADKTAVATIANKVDKVSGKALSTNDYTDADKAAVATIADKLNAADVVALTNTEIDAILNA